MNVSKLIQRRVLDVLATRNGILGVLLAFALLLSSAFFFGEAIVEWSSEKYAVLFNSFSDNLLEKSFRTRLCLPVPIDVVYTWVNGTDPTLLADLRKAKAGIEKDLSDEGSSYSNLGQSCTYANCIKAPLLIFPMAFPLDFSLNQLKRMSSRYHLAHKLETMGSDDALSNFTIVYFDSVTEATEALSNDTVSVQGDSHFVSQAYYTSDVTIPYTKMQVNLVLVSGFKKSYTSDEVKELLPKHIQPLVLEIRMEGSVALFKTPSSSDASALIQSQHNFTVDGRYLQYNLANLVYEIMFSKKNSDLAASRFEDNEELRYSLRSLEQFAPWIRHVYLVTNGQLPYWLNLDNPRLTIVTHKEIFTNQSHLPTFSSPAIESHIHKIEGLSDKFIYMNDDVMLAAQVWPDDFYTHSKGQKVYLAWPIPDCAPGCPNSWIKDGYCDKACNVSSCGWDAGDCDGGVPAFQAGGMGGVGWDNAYPRDETTNCNMGCSNTWMADKYCDQACNVEDCGFDAGDCGISNFHLLHRIDVVRGEHRYKLPKGITVAYLNITSIFTDRATEASYNDEDILRAATICNKFKILTVVLYANVNLTTIEMNITFGEANANNTPYSLWLTADTNPGSALTILHNDTTHSVKQEIEQKINGTEKPFVFEDVPYNQRAPHPALIPEQETNLTMESTNTSLLPQEVRDALALLQTALQEGELTEKGYTRKRSELLRKLKSTDGPAEIRQGRQLLEFAPEGFMPWESKEDFVKVVKKQDSYRSSVPRRKLMDAFAQSLHHVNDLYNKIFGARSRKVPGHIPHMIDKEVIADCQKTFPKQWDITSSHKIRQGDDMQYAFSYNYFLMDSKRNNSEVDFLQEMDIDNSGVLSDRELRTLATRIYDSPLNLEHLSSMENHIINCSTHLTEEEQKLKSPPLVKEVYYEKQMPQVTLPLLYKCDPVLQLIKTKVPHKPKYKFETMGDDDISFKMIGTNMSTVVGQLDDIRRHPKKFVCLNDNIDHARAEALQVKALLADFYESLFPVPSQFELPREYRNRFLHVDDLREWRKYRDRLKLVIEIVLVVLVIYTIYSFYSEQVKDKSPTGSTRPHLVPSKEQV